MGWEDKATNALMTVDYSHHEIHAGSHFFVEYSVADIGAMTTPDDMITLSWKTPNTLVGLHMLFSASCEGGSRVRLIKGKTGGGASPTGTLQTYNNNGFSAAVSKITDVAGLNAGKVSYDATLFTGGESLIDEFLTGTGFGNFTAGSDTSRDNELILAPNTEYQLSILEAGNVPATLRLSWYEHIAKDKVK